MRKGLGWANTYGLGLEMKMVRLMCIESGYVRVERMIRVRDAKGKGSKKIWLTNRGWG